MRSTLKVFSRTLLAACLTSGVVAADLFGADTAAPTAPKTQPKAEAADQPNPKHDRKNPAEPEPGFEARHEQFMHRKERLLKHGGTQFILVGDSITDGWHNGDARDILEENFGQYKPYNIGIGGDRTQHVLWRLDKGEVDGINPKAAMLMIGTNNLSGNTNEEIAAGVKAIVKELHEKLPNTKILLLAIFPRGAKATDPNRPRIKAINEELAKLDDGGKTVKYLDIGQKFLDAEGNLPADIMPDALHPNAKGYQIWADAVGPTLEELMK